MPDSIMSVTVTLTENAARRIKAITEPGQRLRLAISGGGCSGFQYGFTFDPEIHDDDKVFERDGAGLVVDETSLDLLGGAELDFVEDLSGAAFQIRNPHAKSSCGCGNSFAIG